MKDAAIAVVGAGISGVLMGMQLRRAGLSDFLIYEKAPDVGGTWLINTYPGLHCDVPSHLYSYTFEPNADWSSVHASRAEIQAYVRSCAEKYDLIDKIRFETALDAARYDESAGSWTVETGTGERASHRLVVSATGGLTAPRIPRIEGRDTFEGLEWHAGAWRHDVDLSDAHVAVIGTAASAVQVVPEVADRARHVTVFQRSPNWVMPRRNRPYTDAEKDAFREGGPQRRVWRQQYRRTLTNYRAFQRKPHAIAKLRDIGVRHIRRAIDDPELEAAVTPAYDPGCKRLVVSDEYYPALAKPHVDLVAHGVTAIDREAVIAADGTRVPVDVIVYCTGYRLGGRADGSPAMQVVGRGGKTLRDAQAARPEAFRGALTPDFPNFFSVCGINGVAGHAPYFLSAEVCTEFAAARASELLRRNLKSIEASVESTRRFNDEIQAELQTMSWASGQCTNFYTDRSGRVVSYFPGSLGRMRREVRGLGLDDLLVERF